MDTTGKTVQGSVSLKPLRSPPIPLNAAQAGSKIAASLASRCPLPNPGAARFVPGEEKCEGRGEGREGRHARLWGSSRLLPDKTVIH